MAGGEPKEKQPGLAPGEDPSTTSLSEAEGWVSVYAELVEFESSMLKSMKERLGTMSKEARRIAEHENIPALEEDMEGFRQWLAFWRERVAALRA